MVWLGSSGQEEDHRTRAELWRRASGIAAGLRERRLRGERVLLLYPPGLAFADAYYGCLLAGAIAVPVPLVEPTRVIQTAEAFAADCDATVLMSTEDVLLAFRPLIQASPALSRLVLIDSEAPVEASNALVPDDVRPDDIAVLQYTSGSTSVPRGVMVRHRNVVANIDGLLPVIAPPHLEQLMVSWMPHYHDGGLFIGFTTPVVREFRMVLLSPATVVARPLRWLEAIDRHGASTSGGPNFVFDLCTRRIPDHALEGLDLSRWARACNGAEPVHAQTLDDFARRFAPCGFRRSAFISVYGMAELTAVAFGNQVGSELEVLDVDREVLLHGEAQIIEPGAHARRLVSTGSPTGDTRGVIVDPERCVRLPDDRVGEIWLAGASMAQGYWGREPDSEAVFRATLADGEGPFLRTGDLGFLHQDQLYVTGRRKEVIIVRGDNHAPQDIEATSSRTHPSLSAAAAAVAMPTEDGREGLAIIQGVSDAVEAKRNADAILDAIEDAVTTHHGVRPSRVVLVASRDIPRTTSGKLRRLEAWRRLRDDQLPVLAERHNDAPSLERPAEVRERLEALLRSHHVDPDAVDESFFAAGLDSLAVIELVAGIEDAFGIRLPPGAVWLASGGDALVDLVLERGLPQRTSAAEAPSSTEHPTSASQRAIWTVLRERPLSPAYNICFAAELHGDPDPERIHRAWDAVVARHPPLRARFHERDGRLWQTFELPETTRLDVIELGAADDVELHDRIQSFSREPFLPETGDVFRVGMLVREGSPPILVLVVHHIVADLPSLEIILRDLVRAHRAPGTPLPLPGGRLLDLVEAEQSLERSARGLALRRFWAHELEGVDTTLHLPYDHPRDTSPGRLGGRIPVELDAETVRGLRDAAASVGGTLHVALAVVFGELLARLTGQQDFAVLTALNLRKGGTRSDVVGDFVNLVPWRRRPDPGASYRAAVEQAARRIGTAFAHADLPFSEIVRAAAPLRTLAHAPVAQVGFHLQRSGHGAELGVSTAALEHGGIIDPEGLHLRPVHMGQPFVQADLYLQVVEGELHEALTGALFYDATLFDASTVARIARSFEHMARAAAVAPDLGLGLGLPTAPLEERRRAARAFNESAAPLPQGAHALLGFERCAAAAPGAPAVLDERRRWSYQALDEIANGVGWALVHAGVRPDQAVGVLLSRGVPWAAAMLGVWKAGAVYVPLSRNDPSALLELRCKEVGARVVIGEPEDEARWRAMGLHPLCPTDWATLRRADSPSVIREASDRAYVCFTSGSTGTGNGVEIEHRSIGNVVAADVIVYRHDPDTRWGHTIHFPWEPSISRLLGPLHAGGRVFIADDADLASGHALMHWFRERRITQTAVITALLMALPAPHDLDDLELVVVGGEACTAALVQRWKPGRRMLNGYGPTETTVLATMEECEDDGRTPTLGRPYPNCRVYVLDERREPVAVGEVGEIYIGGVGVARGYVARPELTAARFLPDPLGIEPGARMYRSGDLGRFRTDGRLEYLGRVDRQIKVSGVRLQPEAVEATLGSCPAVHACTVQQREGRLGAWVVLEPGGSLDAVQRFARANLVKAAVPTRWVALDELPLTPTGKVDASALRLPDASAQSTERSTDPVEARLMQLFAQVLPAPPPSARSDFFDLGGDSLGLLRLLDIIEAEWGLVFTHAQFVADPTPEGVARGLAGAPREGSFPILVPLRTTGDRPPMFCVVAGHGDLVSFRVLAAQLPAQQPFYACQPPLLRDDEDLEALVERYAAAITEVMPTGPCRLGGYSSGGLVALEIARRLRAEGRDVDFLAMLDTPGEMLTVDALVVEGSRRILGKGLGQLMATRSRLGRVAHFVARDRGFKAHADRLRGYVPDPYLGPLTLFVPTWSHQRFRVGRRTWERVAPGDLEICRVPGDHESFIRMPHVVELARELGARLARAGS